MPSIVILGGTCFQGRRLIHNILNETDWEIVVVNRGKRYWGGVPWEGRESRVLQVKGDREEKNFAGVLRGAGVRPLACVDFSCFHPRMAREILPVVENEWRGCLYIFISSDSVYDVAVLKGIEQDKKYRKTGITEDCTEKYHAALHKTEEMLHRRNRYGGNKKRIEEILRARSVSNPHFAFLALRLADVIGPHEDTGRFWAGLLLSRFVPDLKKNFCATHKVADTTVSFTFSEDVAFLILTKCKEYHKHGFSQHTETVVQQPSPEWDSDSTSSSSGSSESSDDDEWTERAPYVPCSRKELPWVNRSFNTSCGEFITINDFLKLLSGGVSPTIVSSSSRAPFGTADFFPSVSCGPIDVSAAVSVLGFHPTPLATAVQKTIDFFVDATQQSALREGAYQSEYKHALGKLNKKGITAVEKIVKKMLE